MELSSDETQMVNSLNLSAFPNQRFGSEGSLSYDPPSSAEVAILDEAHPGQNLLHVETMTSTSAFEAVTPCEHANTEQRLIEEARLAGGQRSPSNLELKTNQNGLNKLDMRMLIMRERFKKLEELDDGDPNADQSPGE